MPDPDLEIMGGGGGGGGPVPPKMLSPFRGSVWSTNKGGPSLDPPLQFSFGFNPFYFTAIYYCETDKTVNTRNIYGMLLRCEK